MASPRNHKYHTNMSKPNELGAPAGVPPPLAGSALSDDDRNNCWIMCAVVYEGGCASVSLEDAQRLEQLGLVKLGPASAAEVWEGEGVPEYSYTVTDAGYEVGQAYEDECHRPRWLKPNT